MSKEKKRNIPVEEIKWIDKPKERKEAPGKLFLLPKERKFPYRNRDGTLNCNLVRAAITRAAQHGYKEVEEKARKIYEKHCKKKEENTEKSFSEFKLTPQMVLRASFLTGLHPAEILKGFNYTSYEILELLV